MKPLDAARPSLTVLAIVVLLAVILSVARVVLIPVALALLLTFILTPAVLALQRRGLSKASAVILVSLSALLSISGGVWALTSQLHQLASDITTYKENIEKKIREVQGDGPGVFDRLLTMMNDIEKEIKPKDSSPEIAVPVKIQEEKKSGLSIVSSAAGPVVNAAAGVGLVIALTITMLFNREDLRNRLIRLAGQRQLTSTTRAIDEATRRISKYLLLQLTVNAGFGLVFGIGLWILGVPYALLWGIMAMIIRFIPYIGTWLAAVLPFVVSIAVSDGWFQPIALIVFTVFIGLAVNNVIEPLLISRTTGVSPLALVVAAAFWTWLWGPVGLVLATPMTVCLGVLGRYVPALQFFDVLFGTDPALDPHHGYYQRLLARDEVEATQLVETYLANNDIHKLCDEMLIPVMVQTKEDRAQGMLSQEDINYIVELTDEIMEDLCMAATRLSPEVPARKPVKVLGCPVKDEIDMLGITLWKHLAGSYWDLEMMAPNATSGACAKRIQDATPEVVLVGCVHPGGLSKVRSLCKNLRRRFPELEIAVCYWGLPVDHHKLTQQLKSLGANCVAITMAECTRQLQPYLALNGPLPQNKEECVQVNMVVENVEVTTVGKDGRDGEDEKGSSVQ
jgi:predicted PurR-regulated permease PerM